MEREKGREGERRRWRERENENMSYQGKLQPEFKEKVDFFELFSQYL